MAEEKTTPPVETPPPATPPPLTGSAAFEAQLDELKPEPTPPPTVPPAPKEAPPAPKTPPKGTAPAPKADKGKQAPTEKALDWKTAPAEFRSSHERTLQELQQTKSSKETELGKLNARLSELDKRKFLTPEQESEYKKKDERIQKIESDLYSRDYRESPEFKDKFEMPWKQTFDKALKEVVGLNVSYKGEDEEEKVRQTTRQDFENVMDAKTDTDAMDIAEKRFGKYASVALKYRERLNLKLEESENAVAEKRNGWTQSRQTMMADMEAKREAGKSAYDEYTVLLSQKYPDHFAEDAANPEASSALKSGLEYIDSISTSINSVAPQEAAKNTALVRMMAGSWGRNQVIIKQLKSENEGLRSELAKYRKSAPGGEETGGTGESGAPAKGGGSAGLAMDIVKLPGT